jgi:uncharacterized protein (TIGR02266 family)
MSDSISAERRRAARAAIVIPVELRDAHGFSLHSTSDLSVGGAFFDRAIPHPIGSRVEVTLRLPGQDKVVCTGEVVNVPDSKQFGMGIRFTQMAEAEHRRLSAFIAAQEAQAAGP